MPASGQSKRDMFMNSYELEPLKPQLLRGRFSKVLCLVKYVYFPKSSMEASLLESFNFLVINTISAMYLRRPDDMTTAGGWCLVRVF